MQNHYRQSIEPDGELSALFKDVFLFHLKDECQHVVLDELELKRHDATLSPADRDRAVDDFIALVGAVDGILQMQAGADAAYFAAVCVRIVGHRRGPMPDQSGSSQGLSLAVHLLGRHASTLQKTVKSFITEPGFERIGGTLATLE